MKRFRVKKGPFSLTSGKVELTEEQHLPRSHSLDPLCDGVFQVVGRVEFKTGEELGIEGEICKAYLEDLEESIGDIEVSSVEEGELDAPLETLTDEQLLKIAGEYDVKDYEHMSREDLIEAIAEVEEAEDK